MVRFIIYSIEWGADSTMSAELTRVAYELSEGGRNMVQVVGTSVKQALSSVNGILVPETCQLVTMFEVLQPDDDEPDDDDNGGTDGPPH